MRVRKTPERDLEETRAELAEARAKAARWNGRVEELEGQVVEKENTMILQAARTVATSPEGLRDLLNMIRAAGSVSGAVSAVDAAVMGRSTAGSAASPAPVNGTEAMDTDYKPDFTDEAVFSEDGGEPYSPTEAEDQEELTDEG